MLAHRLPLMPLLTGVEDTFAATMSAELEAMEAQYVEVRGMQNRWGSRRP